MKFKEVFNKKINSRYNSTNFLREVAFSRTRVNMAENKMLYGTTSHWIIYLSHRFFLKGEIRTYVEWDKLIFYSSAISSLPLCLEGIAAVDFILLCRFYCLIGSPDYKSSYWSIVFLVEWLKLDFNVLI